MATAEDHYRDWKDRSNLAQPDDLSKDDAHESDLVSMLLAKTPARLMAGRAGAAYRTRTQLELRQALANARDAVRTEFNIAADFGEAFVRKWDLVEVSSQAVSKDEYLRRPDLGRRLDGASREKVEHHCPKGQDLQIAIGDGLSATAVALQVPPLLPLLCDGAKMRGWSVGSILAIRQCRVGVLNDIGELLKPRVVVLLIGERPGLATTESLSAYMAYRPKASDTDANRNLISNIHARGVDTEQAVERILTLAALMVKVQESGCQLKEKLPTVVARRLP